MKTNNNRFLFICFIFFLAMLVGCASTATQERLVSEEYEQADFTPADGDGYMYARLFRTEFIGGSGGFGDFARALNDLTGPAINYGVVLRNVNTDERLGFLFEASANASIKLSAVPPGTYKFDSIELLNQDGFLSFLSTSSDDIKIGTSNDEKDPDDPANILEADFFANLQNYNLEFSVKENEVVYLGDFILGYFYDKQSIDNVGAYGTTTTNFIRFTLDPYAPLDRFTETTEALYKKYPFIENEKYTLISNMDNVTRYNAWDDGFHVYDFIGQKVTPSP